MQGGLRYANPPCVLAGLRHGGRPSSYCLPIHIEPTLGITHDIARVSVALRVESNCLRNARIRAATAAVGPCQGRNCWC
jgi:hypothetical protein